MSRMFLRPKACAKGDYRRRIASSVGARMRMLQEFRLGCPSPATILTRHGPESFGTPAILPRSPVQNGSSIRFSPPIRKVDRKGIYPSIFI
jgi:hypothetical protein